MVFANLELLLLLLQVFNRLVSRISLWRILAKTVSVLLRLRLRPLKSGHRFLSSFLDLKIVLLLMRSLILMLIIPLVGVFLLLMSPGLRFSVVYLRTLEARMSSSWPFRLHLMQLLSVLRVSSILLRRLVPFELIVLLRPIMGWLVLRTTESGRSLLRSSLLLHDVLAAVSSLLSGILPSFISSLNEFN